jgi:hypothetical protein
LAGGLPDEPEHDENHAEPIPKGIIGTSLESITAPLPEFLTAN